MLKRGTRKKAMWHHKNVLDIDVSPDLIRQGADEVDQVAQVVGTAHGAAQQALPDGAFGLMCTPFLKPAYDMVKFIADDVIETAAWREENIADSLRSMADRIEDTDEEVARRFNRLEAQL